MTQLTFSNTEVKKIIDIILKEKPWVYEVKSDDGVISWKLSNNIKASKIEVYANNKYIDDYPYDIEERDDVYATILNVLDYLTNIVNKYNKKNKIKEEVNNIENNILPSSEYILYQRAEEFKEAISQGMLRAYSKRMKEEDTYYTCKSCNQNIPKYAGNYPEKCPKCGENIKSMKEEDKSAALWSGPFKEGDIVSVSIDDTKTLYDATLVMYNPTDNTYGVKLESGDDVGKLILNIKPSQIK